MDVSVHLLICLSLFVYQQDPLAHPDWCSVLLLFPICVMVTVSTKN